MRPIDELVVVELVGSIAGGYAGKLLADHGAQVTLVDANPPPLTADHAAWHFVHSTKNVEANLGELADGADVVIESSAPDPLEPLVAERDGLVRLHLSPHGSTGVYAGFRSTDLTDYALSGHQYLHGDPERHPLPGPPNQPAYAAGLLGAVGVLASLLSTHPARTVEVSHVEAMAALHQFTLIRHEFGGQVLKRMGNRFTGQGEPNTIYRCADGWVAICCVTDQQIESLLDIIDRSWVLDGLDSPQDVQLRPELVNDGLVPWLAERCRDEVVELFQALRIPTSPAVSMSELLDDPQLADRAWWTTSSAGPEQPGTIKRPGPPVRLSDRRWGSSEAGPVASRNADAEPDVVEADVVEAVSGAGPLAGLRVLDLTRVWAGPLAARILADLGADVVMVEAPWNRGLRTLPQSVADVTQVYPGNDASGAHWNRNGHLNKFASNKRSLVLDLGRDEGVATFRRVAASADVVIENYSPRVMPQFGLDADALHQVNPDLVMVTMPGYGRSGPARDWVAYGSGLDAHGGLASLMGYADDHPWKPGLAWPDPIAGLHAVIGTLIAVWDRRAGVSRGQTVEVAQFESLVNVVGDQVLAAQLGSEFVPLGGRHETEAPHGVYRCLGDDRWVSVAVTDDAGWQELVPLLRVPADWADWDTPTRRARHDEIDEAITKWTEGHDAHLVMYRLQEVGVAAGVVLDAPGIQADPQLNSRAVLATFAQPEVGTVTLPRIPIRFDGRFPDVGPAPGLGQHNREILAAAGLSIAEIEQLAAEGVVVDEPPG